MDELQPRHASTYTGSDPWLARRRKRRKTGPQHSRTMGRLSRFSWARAMGMCRQKSATEASSHQTDPQAKNADTLHGPGRQKLEWDLPEDTRVAVTLPLVHQWPVHRVVVPGLAP